MIIENSCTEIGDILFIKAQTMVLTDNLKITGFSDSTNESPNMYFDKKFRYSFDGNRFSEWMDLDNTNLSTVERDNVEGLIHFEFRYERAGIDTDGVLVFNGLTILGDALFTLTKKLNSVESIFGSLVEKDFYTEHMRNNFLRKLFHYGIIPEFIERGGETEDDDFILLWSTVAMFLSYFSTFSENFDNIPFKSELLTEYIKQNNIAVNSKETVYLHLYYIVSNFFDEIRKRGTIKTTQSEIKENKFENEFIYNGEWLRLLNKNYYDEFLIEVIKKEHNGYYVNKSSLLYNGTLNSNQINKTKENTRNIISLENYNVSGDLEIKEIPYSEGYNARLMKLTKIQDGIGLNTNSLGAADLYHADIDNLILIDDEIDYEFSFDYYIKSELADRENKLQVGVSCFNKHGVLIPMSTKSASTGLPKNMFWDDKLKYLYPSSPNVISSELGEITEYTFKGIIYGRGSRRVINDKILRVPNGNLIFNNTKQRLYFIDLFIKLSGNITGSKDTNGMFIRNIKFRPLVRGKWLLKEYDWDRNSLSKNKLITSDYISKPYIRNPHFLQSNTFVLNWRRNNNQEKNNDEIDDFIQNYLLPYQQKIVSIPLSPDVSDKQLLNIKN